VIVTEDMETELGAGRGSLLKLADLLGEDETGVKVEYEYDGSVRLKVDSTAYPSKSVWLTPDDADALADLIKAKAAQARARQS
jgi:hypothetical protein